MAEERQPPAVVEGATTGDVEEEMQSTAKSAEDRKAAAALSKLDANDDESAPAGEVDQQAVKNAMNALGASTKTEVKNVKVDQADVALLVCFPSFPYHAPSHLSPRPPLQNPPSNPPPPNQVEELELSKPKATELLKAHDGNAVEAIRAYLTPTFA